MGSRSRLNADLPTGATICPVNFSTSSPHLARSQACFQGFASMEKHTDATAQVGWEGETPDKPLRPFVGNRLEHACGGWTWIHCGFDIRGRAPNLVPHPRRRMHPPGITSAHPHDGTREQPGSPVRVNRTCNKRGGPADPGSECRVWISRRGCLEGFI